MKEPGEEIRIGVDTGGTFTDFVIYKNGRISIKKIPSMPENPSLAILKGIGEFLGKPGLTMIVHGSTVATNALLERKGAKTALLTTRGFEDILLIGRQTRSRLYNLKGEKREPLIPSNLCFGLDERTAADGTVLKEISIQELDKILEKIVSVKVKAVAVSLINSYANSTHERIIEKELQKRNILASISTNILPEYREYERTATTAANAYLMPVVNSYLSHLEKRMRGAELRIMQSNEGYISTSCAKKEPLRTALSGPAGGVVGAFRVAKLSGFRKIISFDMGGTSTDVSLLEGQIKRTTESVIGDFPLRLPVIDIHSVGAGGGSLAYVDRGGSLRVGPQSAGADPGPACYGKGNLPTVTDANLVLGRLDPDYFLGGKMKLFPQRSFAAVEKVARKIGKSLLETAQGMIDIANSSMEKAIRVISIERGIDPRSFTLFSFGGAGGMHAAAISRNLGLETIIVPKNAGVLSALGLLLSDSIKDYSRSILKTAGELSQAELEMHFSSLENRSLLDMKKDGFEEEKISILRFLDLRYQGQSYEITVPYRKAKNSSAPFAFIRHFHRAHERLYSYFHPQREVEVVNIRVKAIGRTKKIRLRKKPESSSNPEKALIKRHDVYYRGEKLRACVYDRAFLEPGNRVQPPALIVDFESTTFLPPGFRLKVDGFLNLIIKRAKR
ncbi:MAG: hydantoinase/oxoprolinase family protein [Candidatus Aminicenantales bacterium]